MKSHKVRATIISINDERQIRNDKHRSGNISRDDSAAHRVRYVSPQLLLMDHKCVLFGFHVIFFFRTISTDIQ